MTARARPGWYRECKYRLRSGQRATIAAWLAGLTVPDPMARQGAGAGTIASYRVATLYFDTSGARAWQERIEGEMVRVKFRYRAYADGRGGFAPGFLELKARCGERVAKARQAVAADRLPGLLRSGPALTEMQSLLAVLGLADTAGWADGNWLIPVVGIHYLREPLLIPGWPGGRITIDRELRVSRPSAWIDPLRIPGATAPGDTAEGPADARVGRWGGHGELAAVTGILEVKTDGEVPATIQEGLARRGLLATSVSKFATGMADLRSGALPAG